MHCPGDFRNCILWAGSTLDVREKKDPSLGLKPRSELTQDACLSHAALSGQQYMVLLANPRLEHFQFPLTVKEIFTAYPTAGG